MSYSNVPLTGQTLGNTRVPINTNFALIQSTISENHYAIGATDAGKHKYCVFPEQSADPTTAVDEVALYAKQDSTTTTAALFLRDENNGTVRQISGGSGTTNGYTYLANGMLLQWGSNTANPGNNGNVSFPKAFSAPPYSVQVTILRGTSTNNVSYPLCLRQVVSTAFSVNSGFNSAHTYYWMAIGPA